MALGTYEEHHEDRFKGREKDTEIMLTMLRQNECVVCYAASGEGKSSLINAGLCPKIRREGMFPIKIVFTTDDFEGKGIPFIEGKNHIDFDKLLLNKIEHCIKEYETNFKKTHNIKEAFHMIVSDRVISAVDNMLVFLDIIHNKIDRLTIIFDEIEFFHYLDSVLLQHPPQQIINVTEMIVKCLSVYSAVLYYLADSDL